MKIHAKVLLNKVLVLKQSHPKHKQLQVVFLNANKSIITNIHINKITPIIIPANSPSVSLSLYSILLSH